MHPGSSPGAFMAQPHHAHGQAPAASASAPSSFSAAAPHAPASAMGFGATTPPSGPAGGGGASGYGAAGAVRVPGHTGNTASWNPASAGNRYVSASAPNEIRGEIRGRTVAVQPHAYPGEQAFSHMSNDGIADPAESGENVGFADGFEDEFAAAGFGGPSASSMANAGVAAGLAASAASGFGEWTPPPERPIIRPAVTANPALRGRTSGGMHRMAGADELGVEESELDKPTYVRRGILPPG